MMMICMILSWVDDFIYTPYLWPTVSCYESNDSKRSARFSTFKIKRSAETHEDGLTWHDKFQITHTHTHTHTHLTALFPGLPRWAGTRKVKPIWILLKQETVSGSSISWAICKSARCSRQITTPAPHHSVFYRPDALPTAQPTALKHWRQKFQITNH